MNTYYKFAKKLYEKGLYKASTSITAINLFMPPFSKLLSPDRPTSNTSRPYERSKRPKKKPYFVNEHGVPRGAWGPDGSHIEDWIKNNPEAYEEAKAHAKKLAREEAMELFDEEGRAHSSWGPDGSDITDWIKNNPELYAEAVAHAKEKAKAKAKE